MGRMLPALAAAGVLACLGPDPGAARRADDSRLVQRRLSELGLADTDARGLAARLAPEQLHALAERIKNREDTALDALRASGRPQWSTQDASPSSPPPSPSSGAL